MFYRAYLSRHRIALNRMMHRRTILSVVLSVGAGCLGFRNDSTPPSEEVINFDELPPDAQNEFVAALEQNGVKECDIALLDVEESVIKHQDEYYTYAVQSGPSSDSPEGCDKDFLNVEKVEEFS